jgi:hypothetical protein
MTINCGRVEYQVRAKQKFYLIEEPTLQEMVENMFLGGNMVRRTHLGSTVSIPLYHRALLNFLVAGPVDGS